MPQAPEAWDPMPDVAEILYDQAAIQQRVSEVAAQITTDYTPRWRKDPNWSLMVISVLRGSVYFVVDLTRALGLPCTIDFMAVASYGEYGRVRIVKDLDDDIRGRDVLVVEDIIDTGMTLGYLLSQLRARNPRSINVATLIERPGLRLVPNLPVPYICFKLPELFVVGYGLDFRERYRTLPCIAVLKEEAMTEPTPLPLPRFAHPSEAEFAKMLDFYRIRWEYEPRTFVLRETKDGQVDVGFSPDFYLPDLDLYIEVTTKKPHLMNRKKRQVEALRAQHPEIQVELLDRADFAMLAMKLRARAHR